jgi:hypothetical protein
MQLPNEPLFWENFDYFIKRVLRLNIEMAPPCDRSNS